METLFYCLATVQIGVGVYLVWQGLQWLAYARRRLRGDPGFYTPRTALLCACKGMEPGLERNLAGLTEFEYNHYEIVFILSSGSDSACSAGKRIAAPYRKPPHWFLSH